MRGRRGDLHQRLRRHQPPGARDDHRHRLRRRRDGVRRTQLRHPGHARQAEPRHRRRRRRGLRAAFRRRGRGRVELPGRRRPGHDVRLRLQRQRRLHAPADLAGAPPRDATGPGSPLRADPVPAARRQDPGDRGLRGRQARRHRHGTDLDPTRGRCRLAHHDQARRARARDQADAARRPRRQLR